MADQFEKELKETIKQCTRWARRNYRYANAIFAISIVCSFVASVLASVGLGAAWLESDELRAIIAVLAALPGIMLLVNKTFRFEERAKWFWRKVRMAERYYRQLRDGSNPSVSDLSRSYSEEEEKLEMEWPDFGANQSQPTKPMS